MPMGFGPSWSAPLSSRSLPGTHGRCAMSQRSTRSTSRRKSRAVGVTSDVLGCLAGSFLGLAAINPDDIYFEGKRFSILDDLRKKLSRGSESGMQFNIQQAGTSTPCFFGNLCERRAVVEKAGR